MKSLRAVSFESRRAPERHLGGLSSYVISCALVLLGVVVGLIRTPLAPKPPDAYASAQWRTAAMAQRSSEQEPVFDDSDPEASSATSSNQVKLVTYTIKEGDTLTSIALRFGTSVDSIAAINNLTSPDRLTVGESLSVLQGASGTIRRVAKGDTLWDISNLYGISIDEIVKANNLKSADDLQLGQLLILPGAKAISAAQVAGASRSSSFLWPLSGTITSTYGWRTHPISGGRSFHEGIDIAASSGTSVKASSSGKVTHVGWTGGYGRLVIISHGNGFETRYGHLSGYAVNVGQTVSAGQVIGYVGQSGSATGPHCHFEIRKSDSPKNPKDYLP
ncbi:MAG: peptidoglycan DD-metalloendopeptidase family protein [Bacillota bacterium]|jgi:murein DD-endopeptidase MepM/ murein hydrolase activator NlpD